MRWARIALHCAVAIVVFASVSYNWNHRLAIRDLDIDHDEYLFIPTATNSVTPTALQSSTPNVTTFLARQERTVRSYKFFLVAPPEYTCDLITHFPDKASSYYQNHLNEESAEIWLHRGFAAMTELHGRTSNPEEADVILIAGYLHLHRAIQLGHKGNGRRKQPTDHSMLLRVYQNALILPNATTFYKPHLLLIPSWNPSVAKEIGIKDLARSLQQDAKVLNLWSVGFERNEMWQGVPVERILPIPYVVRPEFSDLSSPESSSSSSSSLLETSSFSATANSTARISNFVFYAGEERKNAKHWAGCHRDKLVLPLQNATNMYVRLVTTKQNTATMSNRLQQSEYNHFMRTSDYCLILCGDTPSSRSLTSAMVAGCIPVRVGSRLRGLCDPPCHKGFGWKPTGSAYPHLPYPETIPWDIFPEVDEQTFMDAGQQALHTIFSEIGNDRKLLLQATMRAVQSGWIYGWGDPTNSTQLGNATNYIWNSFQVSLSSKR